MAQFVVTVDAVGVRRADARVGLDDDGIADLGKECLGIRERRDRAQTRGRDARFLIKGLHGGFILDVIHVAELPARADVEIRTQTRVALEPELIIRLEPIDAAVFERKERDGAQHLM